MIKLGPHSLIEMGDTVAWCTLRPTVVKLCFDFAPAPLIPPGITVIGRPMENFIGAAHPLGQGDPTALGAEMAETIYAPLARAWPRIDVWEASNEVNPDDLFQMQWYARFLAAFAERVHAWGKRAAIGSFATGTPQLELWPAYVPALKACRDYGALHARHCYGPLDVWHSFRYRQDQAIFSGLGYCPQVVITECGEDAPDPPWRRKFGNDIQAYYQQWLKPFTLGVNQDPYVLGATVFTVGDGHAQAWHAFDVSGTGLIEILRTDPDIQLKESEPVYIATVITESDGADAHAAFVALHRWVAEHAGSPRGFQWPAADWPPAPFDCVAGPVLRWYHAPTDAEPYKQTNDRRDLHVFFRQDNWFQVLTTPAIWVRAEDCLRSV